MNSKEKIKNIKSVINEFYHTEKCEGRLTECANDCWKSYQKDCDEIKQDLDRLEQLERRFDEFKLDYIVVEKYARKYKSLISGNLWRDGETRTKWFNKIRSQKDWIDYLSHLRQCQSNDDEQLLRIVNHLDTQVLYWALLSLEKEIKRYSEEKFEDD